MSVVVRFARVPMLFLFVSASSFTSFTALTRLVLLVVLRLSRTPMSSLYLERIASTFFVFPPVTGTVSVLVSILSAFTVTSPVVAEGN